MFFEREREREGEGEEREREREGEREGGKEREGKRGRERFQYVTHPIPVLQSVQQNGSWYIHVFCVKSGFSLDPNDEDYSPNAMAHSMKRTNGLFDVFQYLCLWL